MNRYLFDSSAIITLVESSKLDELLEGWTIDLAFYELGNAVWKQVHLYRTLSMDEAKIALDALVSVFDKMRKVQELEPLSTLVIAVTERLSYYDAAYLQAAADKKMILVTDDKTLRQVGGKYVNTVTSREAI
jgi:predicted nucleic acid-binding protein